MVPARRATREAGIGARCWVTRIPVNEFVSSNVAGRDRRAPPMPSDLTNLLVADTVTSPRPELTH